MTAVQHPDLAHLAPIFSILANIANLLIIFTIIIAWLQYRGEHRRARKEKAIDYIFTWVRTLNRRATLARELAETLDLDTTRLLFLQRAFSVEVKYASMINGIFSENVDKNEEYFYLDTAESAQLRWLVVSYLNNLEAIMTAWQHKVADRKIISDQFSFLINPAEGLYILENYRHVADGAKNYPGITAFQDYLIT